MLVTFRLQDRSPSVAKPSLSLSLSLSLFLPHQLGCEGGCSGVPQRGMGSCSRLCDLITSSSLLPYIEPKPVTLNKETEKKLLVSLSLVLRGIQSWANEISCRSEQEIVLKPLLDHNCFQHLEQPFSREDNCLANIISLMVAFLTFDSRFVQHLAGNILVSVSTFLAQCGSKWVKFLRLIWFSLEASVSNLCLCAPPASLAGVTILADESLVQPYPHCKDDVCGTNESVFDFTSFLALLQSRLVNTNALMVAGLFQILRSILKSLKHDSCDLEQVFILRSVTSLLKMPWDLLSGICVSRMFTSESPGSDGLLDGRLGLAGTKDVLLGTVLQLLSSLVEQKELEELRVGSLEELAIYSIFTNLVPKLLYSCFSKHDKHLSRYMSHKVLMLMFRLSFHKLWQSSCPMLWLKLLRQYFEDLLYGCIPECHAGLENCLEGSPFLASFVDGDKVSYLSNRHLQRQAVLLLFKCCFTLARISKDTSRGCECVESPSFTCELQFCSERCCGMGLLELSEWIQRCGFLEKFLEYENYSKSCSRFALSFLQLYIEDDDMLFEMLLQLLDAPFFTLQIQSDARERSFEELKSDNFFHLSSIFNPIHLFHLFLLLLHYDHLVLVDYLISKDTGIHCLQYLLRCLRMICESWLVFVEFSICESEISQPRFKRRKISLDEEDCSRKLWPFSSSSELFKRRNSRRNECFSMDQSMNQQTCINAKECLLSLKRSVEHLHEKKLFPYNPKPLLRSFSRFQELCEQ